MSSQHQQRSRHHGGSQHGSHRGRTPTPAPPFHRGQQPPQTRPAEYAPRPVSGSRHENTNDHQREAANGHQYQSRNDALYVAYANGYHLDPNTHRYVDENGYRYEDPNARRPNTAAPESARSPVVHIIGPPRLAPAPSLRAHVRDGLRRLGRRLHRSVAPDNSNDGPHRRHGSRPPISRPRMLSKAEFHAAVDQALLNAPMAAPLADPPRRRPVRATTAPPAPPTPPPPAPSGPSAGRRRRAKFSGDDDDLYYRVVGRDAEKGVTYREPRYK